MKYKLKFRVSGLTEQDGKSSRKFSVNMEEGQSFVLGKYIPGVQHSLAILLIRNGTLYATNKSGPREMEGEINLNGMNGDEFRIKAGDILRAAQHTVEFLEVPHPAETKRTETQFVDISELSAITEAPVDTPPETGHDTLSPSAPMSYVAPATQAPAAQAPQAQASTAPAQAEDPADDPMIVESEALEEVPVQTGSKLPPRPDRQVQFDSEICGIDSTRSEDFRESQVNPRINPQANPQAGLENNSQANPDTSPKNKSQRRFQILSSLLSIFLAFGVTCALGDFGSPVIAGLAGITLVPCLAFILASIKNFTRSTGGFVENLRFLSFVAFALMPWAYAARLSPLAAILSGLLPGMIFLAGYVVFLKANVKRTFVLSTLVSALPTVFVFLTSNLLNTREFMEVVARGLNRYDASGEPSSAPALPANEVAMNMAPINPPPPAISENRAPATALVPAAPGSTPAQAASSQPVPAQAMSTQAMPAQAMSGPAAPEPAPAPEPKKTLSSASIPPQKELNESSDPLATDELFSAIRTGNLQVVREMINSGAADPNLILERGTTPLMAAAAAGQTPVVKFLLTKRISVDAKDPNGTTALMWAVYKDHHDIVKLLLKKGANPGIARGNGQTALDIARRWKRRIMIPLLEEGRAERSIASKKIPRKKRH